AHAIYTLSLHDALPIYPDGNPIGADKEKSLNIYQMNYEEVRKFDSGSRGNDKFPDQEKLSVYKPLLSEVIEVCEKYAEELARPRSEEHTSELQSRENLV